ncbi:MAG TPA: type II toxin-antitoxin system VapC family toxin [bacterium]|nr:type II toxin-antitoxin system VapC family toxin [bacterium]
MALLLDTCTLWWLTSEPDRLSESARRAIEEDSESLFVSSISALELAMKIAKGKLGIPLESPETWFREVLKHHGVEQVPINFQIASHSGELPQHHKDPYDRLIVATALEYGMTIITPDALIKKYDVNCLW